MKIFTLILGIAFIVAVTVLGCLWLIINSIFKFFSPKIKKDYPRSRNENKIIDVEARSKD